MFFFHGISDDPGIENRSINFDVLASRLLADILFIYQGSRGLKAGSTGTPTTWGNSVRHLNCFENSDSNLSFFRNRYSRRRTGRVEIHSLTITDRALAVARPLIMNM